MDRMPQAEPERLLVAAQSGDRAALERLLLIHQKTVFRYGLRYCHTTEDAEDAVQETLWAAARAIGGFRRAAAITTWLFAIVRNKCHRLLQGRRAEPEAADLLDALPASVRSAEDEAGAREVSRILSSALARLDPDHREVILLRDVQGLTAPEAADQLGITVQALKSRLHRAREGLKDECVRTGLTIQLFA
jgi:RNA polymerase sigma-70 factor (ECF subfamily)